MEHSQFIDFQRTRDFSNKMNATIEFAKQNFKPLFRVMLYIVGPPALIVSLLMGSVMTDYFRGIFGSMGNPEGILGFFTADFIVRLVLAIVIATVTSVITLSAVNNYIILYREKKSTQIEVEEVWDRVKNTFWMYFWTVIGWVVLAILAFVAMIIPVVVLGAAASVLAALLVFVLIIALYYLMIANSLVFVIRGFESRGFLESFGRSMYLVRGKWWSTFGLFVVFYLIISVISSMFFLPWYFSRVISSLHDISQGRPVPDTGTDWFGIFSMAVQNLVGYLLGVLPQIALVFQYFNLVERKESTGLMEKMNTMGSPPPPPASKSDTERY